MPQAIVFDDGKGDLGPLTDLRPVFHVRTGALTTLERWSAALDAHDRTQVVAVWTPAPLAALARERSNLPVNDLTRLADDPAGVLLVNGRCIMPMRVGDLSLGHAIVCSAGGVVAARLRANDAAALLATYQLPPTTRRREAADAAMLDHPWDVIRFRDRAIDTDMARLIDRPASQHPAGVIVLDESRVRIAPSARVYPGVTLDAEQGPIVIDDDAVVRPGAVVIGPAYIGKRSTVLDRALVKGHTAIGPTCKVAGEVGGVIFQGYSNKAHDGHLGDSWIGEWVNLGAGTTNSNLLNTYGEVIAQAEPNGPRLRTGLQFLGCVVGDHVKTAILTRLMTGSVIGTGSMLAAMTPPAAVGRFEWITDDPAGGIRRQPYKIDKFLAAARAMMARRKIEMTPASEARLRELARPT